MSVELLAYRHAAPSAPALQPCDVAATRLVLACSFLADAQSMLVHDPDGHALVLTPVERGT